MRSQKWILVLVLTRNVQSLVSSSVDPSASAIATPAYVRHHPNMMSVKAKAEWHDSHARSRIASEDANGLVHRMRLNAVSHSVR